MSPRGSKHLRCLLATVREEAERYGISVAVDPHGRHPKLLLSRAGVTRKTPLSASPRSADQALKHKLADVRRIIREMTGRT